MVLLFRSLWGFGGTLDQAINQAQVDGFNGLEVNLNHPALNRRVHEVSELLQSAALELVIELVSGGDYVPPLELSWQQHLNDLDRQLAQAEQLRPLRINLIAGSDSWNAETQDCFLAALLDRIDQCGCPVSMETHRSRSLFNPWTIAAVLHKHPRLRLTADISHWCAVSERLMTPELEPIQAITDRVDHIHARVGHRQGPSVTHPFAPEWGDALEAHRRCWQRFAQQHASRGQGPVTITPEFGPDGYLPTLPFTDMAVADLNAINAAMARWLRQGALET